MHLIRGLVPPARAGVGGDHDVIAGAKPQQRRGAVAQVGQHELAAGAVLECARGAGLGVDQLGVDDPARAEVHPAALLALAPQRDADVADPHRLGHLRPPAPLEHRAERRLAAARLAGHQHPLDGRAAQVDPPLGRRLDQVGGVGRGHDGGLRSQTLDRGQQPLGVAGPDRDVAQAEPLERRQRRAGDERARVVARDDPLAGGDARRRVAARGAGDPVVDVGRPSAGCSSAFRSCRSSSRSARSRRRSRRGGRRSGSRACRSSRAARACR